MPLQSVMLFFAGRDQFEIVVEGQNLVDPGDGHPGFPGQKQTGLARDKSHAVLNLMEDHDEVALLVFPFLRALANVLRCAGVHLID